MTSRSFESAFPYSFSECVKGSWNKWPSPHRPDVLTVDIINKHYDPVKNTLSATRFMILSGPIPRWLQVLTGGSTGYFLEESYLDFDQQTFIMKGTNLSLSSLFDMVEVCRYGPEGKGTRLEQDMYVHTSEVLSRFISGKVEKWALDNYQQNIAKGKKILAETIEQTLD